MEIFGFMFQTKLSLLKTMTYYFHKVDGFTKDYERT